MVPALVAFDEVDEDGEFQVRTEAVNGMKMRSIKGVY